MSRRNGRWVLMAILCLAAAKGLTAQGNSAEHENSRQGSIGVQIENNTGGNGARIVHVLINGPAAQAGLRDGDLVVAINGISVHDSTEMVSQIHSVQAGTAITIDYQRAGEKRQASVTALETAKIYRKEAILELAKKGDVFSQASIADRYGRGDGFPQDYAQAALWYRKAADQGDINSELQLGILYYTGKGVPQDYEQALFWYQQAADGGEAYAQYNLGFMYKAGQGMKKPNQALAFSWFRKAAEQGDADAEQVLATYYQDGVATKKDPSLAAYWKNKASDQRAKEAAEEFTQFQKQAAAWRALATKPVLPDAVRVRRLMAEDAIKNKKPEEGLAYYKQGLDNFATWPEGWFNAALVAGELGRYSNAADYMRNYLELVPDAIDAQTARDQLEIWKIKAQEKK